MPRAITTTYFPPSTNRAAYVKAYDYGSGTTVKLPDSVDQSWPTEVWHQKAAEALRDEMSWEGRLIGGGVKNGMVWVFWKGEISDFVRAIARLETEDEVNARTDDEGISGDDAVETLSILIRTARGLV
jgi:hypothetical protein